VTNVIHLKTHQRRPRGGRYNHYPTKSLADIRDKLELASWRTISFDVGELGVLVRKLKDTLELLPGTVDKSQVIFDLSVALAKIEVELAIRCSQVQEMERLLVG
jgi:hypothetical protein